MPAIHRLLYIWLRQWTDGTRPPGSLQSRAPLELSTVAASELILSWWGAGLQQRTSDDPEKEPLTTTKTTILFAVGFAVVNRSQVPPVARIVIRLGGLQQLLGGDEAAAKRDFFRAGDAQPLTLLDDLHEMPGLDQ
jgi:hypothetical protein